MEEHAGQPVFTEEEIASVVYTALARLDVVTGTLAPDSVTRWEDLPEVLQQVQVERIRSVIGVTSVPDMHDRWCKAMADNGWRHGERGDIDCARKVHPRMLPWAELPPAERLKVRLVPMIVLSLWATP
jgi:hypothetical protein